MLGRQRDECNETNKPSIVIKEEREKENVEEQDEKRAGGGDGAREGDERGRLANHVLALLQWAGHTSLIYA